MYKFNFSASQHNTEPQSATFMYCTVYNSGLRFSHFSVCYHLDSWHYHCIIYCSYLDPLFSTFYIWPLSHYIYIHMNCKSRIVHAKKFKAKLPFRTPWSIYMLVHLFPKHVYTVFQQLIALILMKHSKHFRKTYDFA
jgi:hypothetical protein